MRVTLTVEVDAAAWRVEYGPNGPTRRDVESYLRTLLQECEPGQLGLLAVVRVGAE